MQHAVFRLGNLGPVSQRAKVPRLAVFIREMPLNSFCSVHPELSRLQVKTAALFNRRVIDHFFF